MDDQNPGFDYLIVREAYPQKKNSWRNKKYLLPVFVQNKWSRDDSTKKLDLATVNTALENCRNFLKNQCTASTGYRYLPKSPRWTSFWASDDESCDEFVLVFMARCDYNNNVVSDAPKNVLYCFDVQMKLMFGPTLAAYVDSLVPEEKIVIKLR